MKYLFSFAFAITTAFFAPSAASAQDMPSSTPKPDARLLQMYDAEYLQRLATLQPDFLQRMNYYLDNSYNIVPQPEGKAAESYATVNIAASETFNIFAFERDNKVSRDIASPKYFRIAGTNNLLMLLSENEFVKKFNTATGRVYAPRKL